MHLPGMAAKCQAPCIDSPSGDHMEIHSSTARSHGLDQLLNWTAPTLALLDTR